VHIFLLVSFILRSLQLFWPARTVRSVSGRIKRRRGNQPVNSTSLIVPNRPIPSRCCDLHSSTIYPFHPWATRGGDRTWGSLGAHQDLAEVLAGTGTDRNGLLHNSHLPWFRTLLITWMTVLRSAVRSRAVVNLLFLLSVSATSLLFSPSAVHSPST
jgi:hypothetical protein